MFACQRIQCISCPFSFQQDKCPTPEEGWHSVGRRLFDSTVQRRLVFTHMYPAQGDEIVLVLYEEEFLLIFCVTIVRSATLLWYDDVGHGERISGLEQTQRVFHYYIPLNYAAPPSAKNLFKEPKGRNRALTGLLPAKTLSHAHRNVTRALH